MLIPRYSLRFLFALTTICAGISLLTTLATQQADWAIALLATVASVLITPLVFAGIFLLAVGLTWLRDVTLAKLRDSTGRERFLFAGEMIASWLLS